MNTKRLFVRWRPIGRGPDRRVRISRSGELAELRFPAEMEIESVSSLVHKRDDSGGLALIRGLGADAVAPCRHGEEVV